ncbi:MAG: hypothetical protein ACTHQE_15730 [Thermomicrobiales bacterium]
MRRWSGAAALLLVAQVCAAMWASVSAQESSPAAAQETPGITIDGSTDSPVTILTTESVTVESTTGTIRMYSGTTCSGGLLDLFASPYVAYGGAIITYDNPVSFQAGTDNGGEGNCIAVNIESTQATATATSTDPGTATPTPTIGLTATVTATSAMPTATSTAPAITTTPAATGTIPTTPATATATTAAPTAAPATTATAAVNGLPNTGAGNDGSGAWPIMLMSSALALLTLGVALHLRRKA